MRPSLPLPLLAGATAAALLSGAVLAGPGRAATPVTAAAPSMATAPLTAAARRAEPIVLTGKQIPQWSQAAAQGVPNQYQVQSGSVLGDGRRDAHDGTIVIPPDPRNGTGVDVGQMAGYAWTGKHWREVPLQVDQKYPYFLVNGRSSFGVYSGVDMEESYAWTTESWKKTAGTCTAQYPSGQGATASPLGHHLGDDDEISFMASDAGSQAPQGIRPPPGTAPPAGPNQPADYAIALTDPLTPQPGGAGYLYLFLKPHGPAFTAANGYVHYQRDANADQWIDKYSFVNAQYPNLGQNPDALGTDNTSYGPNLTGTVCDPDGTVRQSTDRFPRDGVTVSTASYQWHATGRWMINSIQVAAPASTDSGYGPNLIDRWKGRAFRLTPDSSIQSFGFENEQTNWEANAALLGEKAGPVRAIREVWGADSGTNVTKVETFYRDAVTYRFHLRVHPIPADGLYGYWDHRSTSVSTYYGPEVPGGVPIDGTPKTKGEIGTVAGQPLDTDVVDPTFNVPSVLLNWDEVAGRGTNGSLVYATEVKSATSLENPVVTPFYRDDACFDDGTGSDPVPRPWPGTPSTDPKLQSYAALPCAQRQGDWAALGFHAEFTGDTDNAFTGVPTTEADLQQWQFMVPSSAPANVGDAYTNDVRAAIQAVAEPAGTVAP